MILVFAIVILCVAGVIGTALAAAHDSFPPMRTLWSYDTRRPRP
ncbi:MULTISPECIES: hypothetical protein [unclassified Microbacterium]|nr:MULTISPECIES: hypothetical protein [unclassified Microbacterium]MCR2784392.1 hypothetical protein [Microbacterium sp. zg.B96]MDL5350698.1 hypothetical protein [Microbacterium sp. zg-YB36]WIM14790.1 hypothetical protein QNO11_09455 [Microbacterium sp. zg-B96]